MPSKSLLKIALLGNPNSGKSSLFNLLTGLNQKVGNFPGVTVDRMTGLAKINSQLAAEIIDLPGTYSLYPKSADERIVFDFLNNADDEHHPDFLIMVADASNLKRNLLLFTQIRDLGFPIILALNMVDVAARHGVTIQLDTLQKELGVPVVAINARKGKGLDQLKAAIACPVHAVPQSYLPLNEFAPAAVREIKELLGLQNNYLALQVAHRYKELSRLNESEKQKVEAILQKHQFDSVLLQSKETIYRYELIHKLMSKVVADSTQHKKERVSQFLDSILIHRVWGYVIFFGLLFFMFQAVFAWAKIPMDLIEQGVGWISASVSQLLPEGKFSDFVTNGLIGGCQGILVFVPQIAILFAFISLLEESGYMSRVMFLMDRLMRMFGLNGRSVVPLISGVACAVPAIMATRHIDNWKERLITIFVTPLMSCSARLPVFIVLIALMVPEDTYFGFLSLQGITLMGLYLLGFLSAICSAWVLKMILKGVEKSYLIMELPLYKTPRWTNVGITIVSKVKAFVFGAGKVIIAISILLWVLASFGPGQKMEEAEQLARIEAQQLGMSAENTANFVNARKLEHSYAGYFGKFIEPAIKPLGFDWKIGISLLSSFAAREVFVSTMSIIYGLGDNPDKSEEEKEKSIIERMKAEKNPETGLPFYSLAVSFSLLIFYTFALQCMSTVAVVYRETKSWKWPVLQLLYMTTLAYVSSLLVYQLLKP